MKKIYEILKKNFESSKLNLEYDEKKRIIRYSFDIIIDEYSNLLDSEIFQYQIFIENEFISIKMIDLENEYEDMIIFQMNNLIFENNKYDIEDIMISDVLKSFIKNQMIKLSFD